MTARGFCVVAALSSQTRRLPSHALVEDRELALADRSRRTAYRRASSTAGCDAVVDVVVDGTSWRATLVGCSMAHTPAAHRCAGRSPTSSSGTENAPYSRAWRRTRRAASAVEARADAPHGVGGHRRTAARPATAARHRGRRRRVRCSASFASCAGAAGRSRPDRRARHGRRTRRVRATRTSDPRASRSRSQTAAAGARRRRHDAATRVAAVERSSLAARGWASRSVLRSGGSPRDHGYSW